MNENKIREINPADYNISEKDIERVSQARLKTVHIMSYTPEYFSTAPKGEVFQALSITETGAVSFDAFAAGEKFAEIKSVRKEKRDIGVRNAMYIFHFLLNLLDKGNYKSLEPRPGCWQVAFEYTDGTGKNFYGPYYEETLINGVDVNEFIMNIIQVHNPNLFGRVDPMLQLEGCIDSFSQVTNERNLEFIFQALQYCIYKDACVDTMVNASAFAVAGQSQENAGGFNIEPLKLEDGERALVAMTSPERVNALPAAYFTMPFEDLLRYTLHQDVIGLFINPGTQNFMLPKDMIEAILASFKKPN